MGQADDVEVERISGQSNSPVLQSVPNSANPQPQQFQPQQPQPQLYQGQQPVYYVQGPNGQFMQTYAFPPQNSYPANYIPPQNVQGVVAQAQQGQQPMYYAPQVAPQIIYVQAPPQVYQGANGPQLVYALPGRNQVQGPGYGLAISSFILFIISLFGFWVTTLPSVIFSLMLCSKKIIPASRRPAVIACSVFELIGWAFVPAFVWYGTWEDVDWSSNNYDDEYSSYPYSYYMWWGWISLIVYYVFMLAFGIPRIVFTYSARNKQPEQL
eukprot:TRINITY_DN3710_c0_g2_i1.p1 TRINITY_DN3710_c0_g2~~TRINITY_DN3710_c0_g2_i1.p1  ORF type:complete len:268 (-),score=55.21 TRINITY_DN3710_c0_g2_i1:99-902(-)